VAVDLVGALDAVMAEPARDVSDGDVLGQCGGGVEVAEGVGDEVGGEPGPSGGALEGLLVGAAGDELVLTALEQVPVGGGAVAGDVLVDGLADVFGQGDVAELPGVAVLQRPELRELVDLLSYSQGAAVTGAAAQADGQGLADAQTAAIPPGTGAIPLPAARGTAGTGQPGNLADPIAASSRRRSSSARPGRQPAPPPT
jgi:hypothetical protein